MHKISKSKCSAIQLKNLSQLDFPVARIKDKFMHNFNSFFKSAACAATPRI